jgi:hypothetical protein
MYISHGHICYLGGSTKASGFPLHIHHPLLVPFVFRFTCYDLEVDRDLSMQIVIPFEQIAAVRKEKGVLGLMYAIAIETLDHQEVHSISRHHADAVS